MIYKRAPSGVIYGVRFYIIRRMVLLAVGFEKFLNFIFF